jgi:transposase
MTQITTIGLDLARRVFQVHAVDEKGQVVVRRQLKRRQVAPFFAKLPRCLIGLEAPLTNSSNGESPSPQVKGRSKSNYTVSAARSLYGRILSLCAQAKTSAS